MPLEARWMDGVETELRRMRDGQSKLHERIDENRASEVKEHKEIRDEQVAIRADVGSQINRAAIAVVLAILGGSFGSDVVRWIA